MDQGFRENRTALDGIFFCTYKDGCNLLSNQFGGGGHIVVGQKMDSVFHVLDSECQTNTHAKGTMIVNIKDRKIIHDDPLALGKSFSLDCGS